MRGIFLLAVFALIIRLAGRAR